MKPEDIKLMHLDVLVMPNGEVICLGKTIGWIEQLEKYLSEPEKQNEVIQDQEPNSKN